MTQNILLNTAAYSFPESGFFILSELIYFKLHGKVLGVIMSFLTSLKYLIQQHDCAIFTCMAKCGSQLMTPNTVHYKWFGAENLCLVCHHWSSAEEEHRQKYLRSSCFSLWLAEQLLSVFTGRTASGPVLFNNFINDLSKGRKFADDMKTRGSGWYTGRLCGYLARSGHIGGLGKVEPNEVQQESFTYGGTPPHTSTD